ncbi:particle associated protein [Yersinia phage fHe-Yen8-01]|nr:particle associated protein [Yersinia phage fHe-Yen8-01]
MSATQLRNGDNDTDPKTKKKGADNWQLENHICKTCFGRIVSQPGEDGKYSYRCTNCGALAYGGSASVLCCCGIMGKPRNRAKSAAPVNLGIRCIINPNPTSDFPAEIVASETAK